MDKSLRQTRIEILMLFGLYIFILPRVYMDYDMGYWREWALAIHHHGISNAYNNGINYFPIYVYCLYIFDVIQGTDWNITHHINSIKILFVAFDFLPVFVLCGFRQKLLHYKIPYLYLLLNIAYVFNSMVWGQLDSIYTNLCFMAIVLGFAYPAWSVFLFTLALNTKPQAIEFLPVLGVIWLMSIKSIKKFVIAAITGIVTQILLLLPFLSNGGVKQLYTIATHSVDLYNKLSICAFNLWYIIVPGNPYFINDKDVYFIFSYKTIGLSLFAIASIFVLIPITRRLYYLRKQKIKLDSSIYSPIFLGTGLICLYFFYFNSQMHERYANPIIIFFFFYGVVSKNYKLYILASIPYFLSLDKCFPDYLPIVHYKIIFASRIIAIWYTAVVIYGSYLYYRLTIVKIEEGNIIVPDRNR
ncbi:MAG: hypothetical protein H7257_03750 [Taibaiella sp.]|nr:hypothetical protein [Taibaiella sp.]